MNIILLHQCFSDCQGNGIKDYANYSVPTLSKEDYVEPVNPTPNNSQTAPKKVKLLLLQRKEKWYMLFLESMRLLRNAHRRK